MNGVERSKLDGMKMKPLSSPYYAARIEGGSAANRDYPESQNSRAQIIKETRTFGVENFADAYDALP